MRTRYIIATVLIFVGFIVHCIGGELTDIKSLVNSGIPLNLKIEFRAVWYIVSADFLFSGIFLIIILKRNRIVENKLLISFIGLRMMVYGLIFLLIVIFIKYDVFLVPQWILLLGIGLLLEWDSLKKVLKT